MSCGNLPEDGTPSVEREETLMPRKRKIKDGHCMKCKTERGVFSRMGFVYCRQCFMNQLHTRINRGLQQSLVPKGAHRVAGQPNTQRPATQPGDVVVALSGGAGSSTLLDMLVREEYIGVRQGGSDEGLEADVSQMALNDARAGTQAVHGRSKRERGSLAPKRQPVWARAWAVHVDFSGLIPNLHDPATELRDRCQSVYSEYEIQALDLRIEDAYDPSLSERIRANASASTEWTRDPTHLASLKRLLTGLPSPSHPHVLQTLLDSLLSTACSALGAHSGRPISHLILGETSTRQAQRIISSTALGGGWGLPLELAPATNLGLDSGGDAAGVTRLKPLRDTMVREAAYHCHLRGLATFSANGWDSVRVAQGGFAAGEGAARGKGGIRSLERLTEDFINGLMSTHPSTVSTITRTGSKLQFRGRDDTARHACPFCGLPSEPSTAAWKARTALSSLRPTARLEEAIPSGHAASGAVDNYLIESLCYACLTSLDPMLKAAVGSEPSKAEGLPPWVVARLGHGDDAAGEHGDINGNDAAAGHLAGSHGGGRFMGQAEMENVVKDFLIEED